MDAFNKAIFDRLSPKPPASIDDTILDALAKQGEPRYNPVDSVIDFLRTKMREDGFCRRIMPPLEIKDRRCVRCSSGYGQSYRSLRHTSIIIG